MEQELENDARFQIRIFQQPKLENHVIDKILEQVRSRSPKMQCHVILLGGNNLRWHDESVDTYISKCASLVQKFRDFPNAKLIFVSLIPSPKSHHICANTFDLVNDKLQILAAQNQAFTSFLNVNVIFLPNGRINHAMFCGDNIHLTRDGTHNIALAISAHVKSSEF